MRTTIFIGPDITAHPLLTDADRDAITDHFAGHVFWVPPIFDLATLAGRVLARGPEAAGRVALVGSTAAVARDWLRPIFPTVPICAVGAKLDWPGAAPTMRAIETALDLVSVEEPW